MWLCYFSGDIYKQNLPQKAKCFMSGLIVHASSQNPKKYSGGRFAVQHSDLEELYYVKDKFSGKKINNNTPAFTINNSNKSLSACKKSYKGDCQILRLTNLSGTAQNCTLNYYGNLYQTNLAESTKIQIQDNTITFKPKEIKTFILG